MTLSDENSSWGLIRMIIPSKSTRQSICDDSRKGVGVVDQYQTLSYDRLINLSQTQRKGIGSVNLKHKRLHTIIMSSRLLRGETPFTLCTGTGEFDQCHHSTVLSSRKIQEVGDTGVMRLRPKVLVQKVWYPEPFSDVHTSPPLVCANLLTRKQRISYIFVPSRLLGRRTDILHKQTITSSVYKEDPTKPLCSPTRTTRDPDCTL